MSEIIKHLKVALGLEAAKPKPKTRQEALEQLKQEAEAAEAYAKDLEQATKYRERISTAKLKVAEERKKSGAPTYTQLITRYLLMAGGLIIVIVLLKGLLGC